MSELPFWKRAVLAVQGRAPMKYRAVIVGQESGNRTALDFIQFADTVEADNWVMRMNAAQYEVNDDRPLVLFAWEELP